MPNYFDEIEARRTSFQRSPSNSKFRYLKGGADLDCDEDGDPNPLKVMMLREEREERERRAKKKALKKP